MHVTHYQCRWVAYTVDRIRSPRAVQVRGPVAHGLTLCDPQPMELRELAWVVEARPGGWVRLKETDGPSVYLHFQQDGGAGQERFDLKTAVMKACADEGLSGRSWRRVPLLAVERFLAHPRVRA